MSELIVFTTQDVELSNKRIPLSKSSMIGDKNNEILSLAFNTLNNVIFFNNKGQFGSLCKSNTRIHIDVTKKYLKLMNISDISEFMIDTIKNFDVKNVLFKIDNHIFPTQQDIDKWMDYLMSKDLNIYCLCEKDIYDNITINYNHQSIKTFLRWDDNFDDYSSLSINNYEFKSLDWFNDILTNDKINNLLNEES